ncbi:SDR family NAD(P)-dependent oxidoreductase [Rhodovulum sp. DZ06]|uniref:SDR family NAD(P)-dependent oxidoreductase n=1 Tax=Rhodovulum sp. DZ06 TaxID=3425126 RepID=UPI003D33632F
MSSLPGGYRALVLGASGGIGGAILAALRADPRCGDAVGLSRSADGLDVTSDAAMARAAADAAERLGGPLHLLVCATGILAPPGKGPEKALSRVTPAAMAEVFAANAIGPAMVFKHFAPLLPKRDRGLVGVLTARVGSIGDNRMGGWTSYRAAKAAANQVVRTAAVELSRTRPRTVALALHPGTVRTPFTEGYQEGRDTLSPDESAARLLRILDGAQQTGRFVAHDGGEVPW